MWWAQTAKIEDAVNATVKEVWRQAQTGSFAFYFVPAREELRFDPLYREEQEVGGLLLEANSIPSLAGIQRGALGGAPTGKRTGVTALKPEELDARLNDGEWDDDQMLFWEKHRRYREALIARLRELYPCQYFDNRAKPGEEDFCYSGITPCYLFDLTRPLVTQLPAQKRPNPKKAASKT